MNPSDPTQLQDSTPDINNNSIPSQPTTPTAVPETAATEPIEPVAELTPELIANNATQQVVSMANADVDATIPTQQPITPQQPMTVPVPQPQTPLQPILTQPSMPPVSAPDALAVAPPPLTVPTFPAKKKGPLKAIIITLIALIIIAALTIGGIFAWQAFAQSPTDRFYSALKNGMSTKYVKLDFVTNDTDATTTYTALVDVTDPTKPNADIKIVATHPKGNESTEMDMIAIGTTDTYLKYSSNPKTTSILDTGGKWIKSDGASATSSATGSASVLSMNFFTLGSYDASLRDEVIQMYKEQHPLQFKDSDVTEETNGGTKLLRYTATVNATAMKAANDKVAQALKLTSTSSPAENEKVVFWIDPSTNRIVRFEKEGALSANDRMTINIAYPSQATITAPSDYMTSDEWAKSLSQ